MGDINLQFLQAHQDNTLHVADDQEVDGVGVGSLYMKQIYSVSSSADVEPRDSCRQSSSSTSKPSSSTMEMLEHADKFVQMLRVSDSCNI